MCKVSFWILFIWAYLIISITLDLVLRQFRFSLRVFKLSSRFFVRDYVKAFFTTLFHFDRFYRFALIRFIFCRVSLDSVFEKEINTSTLDIMIAILMLLCNSTLSYYVNRHSGSSLSLQNSLTFYILKLICISSILFSIYFQWIWQGEFVKQSRVLKLMIISFILVTFLFYSGVILWGEIRCKSILEFKGLTAKGFVDELDDRSLSIWIYTT